jgi:hypothetical protein
MAGCPPKIRELVERFSLNIEQYKSGKYNEAQVRQEFIDPDKLMLRIDRLTSWSTNCTV